MISSRVEKLSILPIQRNLLPGNGRGLQDWYKLARWQVCKVPCLIVLKLPALGGSLLSPGFPLWCLGIQVWIWLSQSQPNHSNTLGWSDFSTNLKRKTNLYFPINWRLRVALISIWSHRSFGDMETNQWVKLLLESLELFQVSFNPSYKAFQIMFSSAPNLSHLVFILFSFSEFA